MPTFLDDGPTVEKNISMKGRGTKEEPSEMAKNTASISYYDDIRRHPDVTVAPLCPERPSENPSHVVRYTVDDESYRLINVGVFLPFTSRGKLREEAFHSEATSVMLATHHFNTASKEILHRSRPESCDVRLTVEFFDTQESPMTSGRIINNDLLERDPCDRDTVGVILGPRRSSVAVSIGVLANSNEIPVISHGATSSHLEDPEIFPLFGQLVASSQAQATAAVAYLRQLGVAHINVLSVPGYYGDAYRTAFVPLAQAQGIRVWATSIPRQDADPEELDSVLRRVSRFRYRYTLAVIETMDQYEVLMTAAHANGMVGKDFVWLLSDAINTRVFEERANYEIGSSLEVASRGVGFIKSSGGWKELRRPAFDRFVETRRQVFENDEMLSYFESKLSLNLNIPLPDHHVIDQDHQEHLVDPVFLYDSIMSIGLTACEVESEYFTGQNFFQRLPHINFEGVSGPVRFDPESASRSPETMLYSVSYSSPTPQQAGHVKFDVKTSAIYCDPKDMEYILPSEYEVLGIVAPDAIRQIWLEFNPFVYNGGTTRIPSPLPDPEISIQGIDTPYLIAGYSFGAVSLLIALLAMVWTWRNRNSRVVRKSQPIFLLMISFGAAVMSSALIPMGLQPPVPGHILDMGCMTGWWLYSIGFVIAFTALFSKTWRLNKIMKAKKFTRIIVKPIDVFLPFGVFMTLNFIILTTWTIVAPVEYRTVYFDTLDEFGRTEIEGVEGCYFAEHALQDLFAGLVIALDFVLVVFTTFQISRAGRVKAEYNETFYIGLALLIVLQSWLIGVPIVIVFRFSNPSIAFMGLALIACMTSCGMSVTIIWPKIRAVRDERVATERRRSERERRLRFQESVRTIRIRQEELANSGTFAVPSRQLKDRRRSSSTTATLLSVSRRSSKNLHGFDQHVMEDDIEPIIENSDHHLSQKDLDALSVIESSSSVASGTTTPKRRGSLIENRKAPAPPLRYQPPVGSLTSVLVGTSDYAESISELDLPPQERRRSSMSNQPPVGSLTNILVGTSDYAESISELDLPPQGRRRSSMSNLTNALFGTFIDDVDHFEVAEDVPRQRRRSSLPNVVHETLNFDDSKSDATDPDHRARHRPSIQDVLFGHYLVEDLDAENCEEEGVQREDESGSSTRDDDIQHRFTNDTDENNDSSLTLESTSKGLKLTVIKTKVLASGPRIEGDSWLDTTVQSDNRSPVDSVEPSAPKRYVSLPLQRIIRARSRPRVKAASAQCVKSYDEASDEDSKAEM